MKLTMASAIMTALASMLVVGTFAMPAHDLEPNFKEREGWCDDLGMRSCNKEYPGVPDFFCCPPNTECVPLAGNTTLICCPTQQRMACQLFLPIPCDTTMMDALVYPREQIKTVALDISMPACGHECCPFGYWCNGDGPKCEKEVDQSSVPYEFVWPDGMRPDPQEPASPAGDDGVDNEQRPSEGGPDDKGEPTPVTNEGAKHAENKVLKFSLIAVGAVSGAGVAIGIIWCLVKRSKSRDPTGTASGPPEYQAVSVQLQKPEYLASNEPSPTSPVYEVHSNPVVRPLVELPGHDMHQG
jgi:hypothetical protein